MGMMPVWMVMMVLTPMLMPMARFMVFMMMVVVSRLIPFAMMMVMIRIVRMLVFHFLCVLHG